MRVSPHCLRPLWIQAVDTGIIVADSSDDGKMVRGKFSWLAEFIRFDEALRGDERMVSDPNCQ